MGGSYLRSGQQGEPSGFLPPTPPNLARENDQPSNATWSHKLGVCSLLPETCRLQHGAIFISRPGMWRTVTEHRWIWSSQVEVAEHRIGHDSASCFPADVCSSTFHHERCGGGPKRQGDGHTVTFLQRREVANEGAATR